jgi:Leucine-rich repeat (LRR) protein
MLKEMVLDENQLSGQLSPAIGQLQHLTKLSISMNSISGGLPIELGSLQYLEFLDLHMNRLNGSIPAAFCNLSRLLHLDLSQNNLSGSIFSGISSLVNLLTLDLSGNNFVGPIPREIGQLKNLQLLILGQNGFTGTIPEEIGNLKWLEVLQLSVCKFTGTIPLSISGLVSLKELDISENNFDAELPPPIGQLGNLTQLIAKSAGLKGSIPKELSNCKNLTLVNLSFNDLTGSIPEEFAELDAVMAFSVEKNNLSGHIPNCISNWANARSISLGQNFFTGPLPLLPLPHLLSFSAESNLLSGSVPAAICKGNSLRSLVLHDNKLTGSIEETFKGCRNLTELNLLGNHFHGEIPGYLSELPLVTLELSLNNFTGMLPESLWESSTLLQISLSNNQITRQFPRSIGRLSSLERLQIDNNYLEGPIPRSIGSLRNLTILSLHGNGLTGNIPLELFNCRNIATLDLSSNNLSGHIPRAISNLTMLNSLILSYNQLSGAIPAEICVGFENEVHPDSEFVQHKGLLDLSYNRLTGQIPTAIKKCSMLMVLNLQGNLLNGTIPSELGQLTNLTTINLSFNGLVGPMLPWSAPLVQLQGLMLSNNHLDGTIPAEIGQILPKISMIDLSGNVLSGNLPQSLLCNKYLNRLDVSNNNLSGEIIFFCPMDTESSSSLVFFNSSSNHFSGTLDESISNCTHLSSLDIHNNSLTGSLPPALSDLSLLNYLDLSSNDFYGSIPCGICNIYGLTFANFSGNHISTYSSSDCAAGGICSTNDIDRKVAHPSHRARRLAIICALSLAFIIVLVLLVVYLRQKPLRSRSLVFVSASKANATIEPTSCDELLGRKSREPLSINLATFQHSLMRVTTEDILKATKNFSKEHIIGDGGFGTVYKAALPEGGRVAIKRLHGGHQFQGDREFLAEMETIGKVKHPNLVPLLGYCVCGDERFLIYEYMENGSLEMWLRNRADAVEALGWPDRLKICLGSARGLAFLHEGFVPHIIHRDMKSSNILLDENFEPRVSDFGLARIISACETHVSTDIAGTFGYIPPEYGMTMKSSMKGDVYSFGVVMLELLTGRPPTGQEDVEGGGNLVGWVRWMMARGKGNELFDPCLPVSGVWREQMVRVLTIALDCTAEEPWKRPIMQEVVKGLKMTQPMECGPLVVTVSRGT